MSSLLKVSINWNEIAKIINKERELKLAPGYLRNVYFGLSTSHDILKKIKDIFDKEFSKPVKINVKKLLDEEVSNG